VCTNDVGSFFECATENESLYPPKCCGQIFLLDLYESHIPFDVQWAFQMKEQGEYSVLAKYRVYCANPACSEFLSPATHVKDPSTNVGYTICQDDVCGKLTCTSCKILLNGIEGHTCDQNEDYKKFKHTATEKGFQECPICASTVELTEACNHINCECGAEFCYICGEQWQGMQGCSHYGPAIYDEEGYNQDGYHRTTGLNREGRPCREQAGTNRVEDGEEDDDPDTNHPVLQYVEPGVRTTFAALLHEEREMFLVNLQIQLFEERGINFGDRGEDDEESDSDGEEDGASDREDSGDANSIDDRNRDEGSGEASEHE
ncbi:hypothetical protein BU25DRAFT_318935, partial [Macroventuria anomochaeta]